MAQPPPGAGSPAAADPPGLDGFILSAALRDAPMGEGGGNRTNLVFQGRLADGRRFHWTVTRPRIGFFISRDEDHIPDGGARRPVALRDLRGRPVDALYFPTQAAASRARRAYAERGRPTYEADVPAAARYLMERGIRGSVRFLGPPLLEADGCLRYRDPEVGPGEFTPDLRLLSLDIETSMAGDLFSVAMYGEGPGGKVAKVFLRRDGLPASRPWPGAPEGAGFLAFPGEKPLLEAFFAAVRAWDPDCLIGWNVVGFDLRWLAGKCRDLGLAFALGVDGPVEMVEPAPGAQGRFGGQWQARVPGRAVLDGIPMLRAAFVEVEDYSLGTVAHEILGESKLIELEGAAKVEEIARRWREDPEALARYNLQDAVLAHRIFAKLGLAGLAVRKARLTGLAVDRMGGSVAALDYLYLPRLHRRGYVADSESPHAGEAVPGGLVLDGVPGFHAGVAVLDFKSLYPSIMRTFSIDPLAAAAVLHGLEPEACAGKVTAGPAGLSFCRPLAILPELIAALLAAREEAKRIRDASLSQAVKIIMNSFYGVLGNQGCRFYHPGLAGTITRIGHWVLLKSRAFLEDKGLRVLYGDTDSLFVHLGPRPPEELRAAGAALAADLTAFWKDGIAREFGIESHLHVEFEKTFLRFFLPSLRGEDKGSKKRYAGLLYRGPGPDGAPAAELHCAGLESSRSDWTPLAKGFQEALLRAAFAADDPARAAASLSALCRDWRARLLAGGLDGLLEYRKGLSKLPEAYVKNVPPHVRAARMLGRREGRVVRYLMTVNGPEPAQLRSAAKPDYAHYVERQLAPIADMVLRFHGTDFRAATEDAQQLSMF